MKSPVGDRGGVGRQAQRPAAVVDRRSAEILQPSPGSHAPVVRPGLAYQYAFDLCVTEARLAEGPVGVLAGNAFHASELLRRLDGCEAVSLSTGGANPQSMDIERLLGSGVGNVGAGPLERLDPSSKAVIWVRPQEGDEAMGLGLIGQTLMPGGSLMVITSGWLTRLLPERRGEGDPPGQRPTGLAQTAKWLRRRGYALEAVYGFQRPESILWGLAAQLAERLGRGDLADRCHLEMRAGYAVKGWRARWARVAVTVARK